MNCFSPNYALFLGTVDGKKKIKFLPKRADLYSLHTLEAKYGKENILMLPCGHCTACQLNYARTWASRCCMEASLYDSNYFITLTYDPFKYPSSMESSKRDVQLFMKRLRKQFHGVRYFGCTELGEHTKRIHHHLILFNIEVPDIKPLGKRAREGYYFESKILERIWSNGFIDIGEVTFKSASYVARYCMKKRFDGNEAANCFMSTKPAIGYGYYLLHKDIIFKYDTVYGDFGSTNKAPVPRYFDKLLEKENPDALEQLKARRISKNQLSTLDELMKRGLIYREELYSVHQEQVERKIKRLKGVL